MKHSVKIIQKVITIEAVVVEIEADSFEEAMDIANERYMGGEYEGTFEVEETEIEETWFE